MLLNLPCDLMCDALLLVLNAHGFAGLYDFVYVPVDFESRRGKGFAFVNMITEEHMQRLVQVFHGYSGWSRGRRKICKVTSSNVQGLRANVRRYRNSPVMGHDVPDIFKPVLFSGTQQVPFPKPTKCLPQIQPNGRPMCARALQ